MGRLPATKMSLLPDIESGDDGRVFGLISTSDMITATLIGHQFPVRLNDDRVEIFDVSVLRIGEHGVAGSQRHGVGERRSLLDVVLGHAGRLLVQSSRVHQAMERH